MEGLRPFTGPEGESGARGEYLRKWLELKDELPRLFTTKDGLVSRAREPKPFEEWFPEVRGYQAIFTNKGKKPKFNPNRVNFELGSTKLFRKCLVADCARATKNLWGICAGNNHLHLEEVAEGKKRFWKPVAMTNLDQFVDWIGLLEETATRRRIVAPDHAGVSEVLMRWVEGSEERGRVADDYVRDVLRNVVGEVMDSTTMQLVYERGGSAPKDVITRIQGTVDRHFGGIEDIEEWPREVEGVFSKVPVKIVATMLALGFAAEEANRGDLWFCRKVLGQPEKSHYASAYMSSAYFFLRRAGATPEQARMSLRA